MAEFPADLLGELTQQVMDRARALGLIWTLRLATVADGTNPAAISAVYDGDATGTAIDMTSMVGPINATSRVYVMQVPPAGNFIVAQADGPVVPLGTMVGTGGTLVSTVAEAAIPSASWAAEPTFVFPTGRIFVANMVGNAYTLSAAPRVCSVRLRKGAQTTTGTELAYRPWDVNLISGIGASYSWPAYFKNTSGATVSTKLSVTAVNPAGATGTVALYGDTQQPLLVTVRDYCSVNEDPDLAAVVVSV